MKSKSIIALIMLLALLSLSACVSSPKNEKTMLPTFENVITKEYGNVKVHSFQTGVKTPVVIENEKLTIIDYPQSSPEEAAKFKEYVESLNKPIDRIIISHGHNTSWLGIEQVFPDVALYSVDADQIHAKAEGASLPITKLEENGTQIIDGIKYEFKTDRAVGAWIIKLPDQKAVYMEHVAYTKLHMLGANIDGKLTLLQELNSEGYTWFMPGEGAPMQAPEFVDRAQAYYTDILNAPREYKTAEEAKAGIIAKYPDYDAESQSLLDRYFGPIYQ